MPESRLRLITESLPGSGAWNMAVDEALLESAINGHDAILRWYRWDEATLSLGYFQNSDEQAADERLRGLPVVRRLSGGGAILHHHEWTYSCLLPPSHPLTHRPHDLYLLIHESIVELLKLHGFELSLRGQTQPSETPDSFLCFQRGDPCDILFHRQKVVRSAQRRRRGGVLQHGSLILRSSPHAPEILGLFDLSQKSMDEEALGGLLAEYVAQPLHLKQVTSQITPQEKRQAQELLESRYSRTVNWNRKSPAGLSPD